MGWQDFCNERNTGRTSGDMALWCLTKHARSFALDQVSSHSQKSHRFYRSYDTSNSRGSSPQMDRTKDLVVFSSTAYDFDPREKHYCLNLNHSSVRHRGSSLPIHLKSDILGAMRSGNDLGGIVHFSSVDRL